MKSISYLLKQKDIQDRMKVMLHMLARCTMM